MPTEIERKFLVTGTQWRATPGVRLSQGYLNPDKDRTVRVRIAGNRAFLTVKGATRGATRAEFEYPIPVVDAEAMLSLCDGPIVEKVRYAIEYEGNVWEVDEFLGANAGLVIAEIELTSEAQSFAKPEWVDTEVTHDARYFNSNLAAYPFSLWRNS